MDRKVWLTMVYREANLFLERHGAESEVTLAQVDELEPELHEQVQSILVDCELLEDFVKYSVLRTPDPSLWRKEESWERVMIGVATACLVYDVQGVAKKILARDLPRLSSSTLHEKVE